MNNNQKLNDVVICNLRIPELEVKSITLPQGRKSEERSSIETARAKLTGQWRVEIGWARAIRRSAKASPSIARFILLCLPSSSASTSAVAAALSGQIQLALVATKSRLAKASVTAFFAQAAASVQARV